MKKEKTAIRRSWPDTLLVREVRLFIKVIKVLTKKMAIRSKSSWSSGHIGHLVSEARVFMEL